MADPLSLVANIIAVLQLTSSVVQYIGAVNEGREERLSLRDEISSAYGPLRMLHDRIVEEQKRLDAGDIDASNQSWLSSVMELGATRGPLEQYTKVLKELQKQKEKYMDPLTGTGRGLKVVGKSLSWPFKKDTIERYMRIIERQKSIFLLAYLSDGLTLSQRIKEDTSLLPEMAYNISDIAETVGKMDMRDNEADYRAVVKWLSPLNFLPTHDDIIRRRQPGTGQWFLESPLYKSWVDGDGETLWCPGIPGAGKTMISAIVTEDLRNRFDGDSEIGVASIYCNYKEQLQQTPENLLAGLWMQLIQGKQVLSDDVKAVYKKHFDRETRPTLGEDSGIASVLTKEIARHKTVYIVIDALDECPESSRVQLLDKIQKIRVKEPALRLLVTSRLYDSIARQFEGKPRLEVKASIDDVRTYVSGRITPGSRLGRHVVKDPSLAKDIENIVTANAQKMFLLAQLHMDSLQSKATPKAVRKTLEKLPKDLDGTYEEAMRRIGDQGEDDKHLGEQILQWISFAVRPLSLIELQEALAVEPDTEELDQDNMLDVELLTSVCCGLVIVDHDTNVIRLVHFSTQEYFSRIRSLRFPAAQEHIARTCLTYLSFDEFAEGPCPDDDTAASRIHKHHLFAYAAENWGIHARGNPQKELEGQILEFLGNGDNVSSAVQVIHFHPGKNWHAGESMKFARDVTGLHYAAVFGLQHIVNNLISNGADVNARDSHGTTPLHNSARGDHADVVKLLLDHGAEIEAKDRYGHTALHVATQSGSKSVVVLLLEKGAAISKGIDGRTALHFAAEFGNEVIASALLRSGADVTVASSDMNKFSGGRTPLHWAAATGSEGLVQLLLESGANVNAVNVTDRTPLQEAIMWNRFPVIKILLEHGASISIKDNEWWTPLHEAALKSTPVVIDWLIDRGAKIDALNRFPQIGEPENIRGAQTPFHLAIVYGRYENYEALKARGADITLSDGNGLAPLHMAIKSHQSRPGTVIKIVESLLDAGIDVNSKIQEQQETALHMAGRYGMVECILCLLERGADVNATNHSGQTALQIAEAAGEGSAVQILEEATRMRTH